MAGRTYCLDSDVVILHLRNAKRGATVTANLEALARSGTLVCSTLTIGEVLQGLRPGEERPTRAFLSVLEAYPVDRAVAERGAEIVRELRTRGKTLGLADALIAATCLEHDLALVTMNLRDFTQVAGLSVQAVP